jgi:hypothetical protein
VDAKFNCLLLDQKLMIPPHPISCCEIQAEKFSILAVRSVIDTYKEQQAKLDDGLSLALQSKTDLLSIDG